MKYKFITLLFSFTFIISSNYAQSKLIANSINSSKTESEKHAIKNVSDKVNNGIDKVFDGSLFKKKKKADKQENSTADAQSSAVSEAGKTVINISNTDFKSLSKLSDALKTNQQVTNIERSFSNNTGTLKITHSYSSDQLFDDLVTKAGDKFDVIDITPGKIDIKMK
ncbi:MAG: hypothetical protein M3Z26_10940 [Bacteroidota bacterium]|nr:hypothetical protein [Bacteroidota bacterium]